MSDNETAEIIRLLKKIATSLDRLNGCVVEWQNGMPGVMVYKKN